jgi:hypothetical protein
MESAHRASVGYFLKTICTDISALLRYRRCVFIYCTTASRRLLLGLHLMGLAVIQSSDKVLAHVSMFAPANIDVWIRIGR